METKVLTPSGRKIYVTVCSSYVRVSDPDGQGVLDTFNNYFEALRYAKSLD